jgi:hypothetical protein
MNIRFLFATFLMAISTLTHGQEKIQGYVLDKMTSVPLPYASIGAVHLQYGCYTDTTGLFTLFFSNENDSVKVSYLGYKSLFYTIGDLEKHTKIYLESDPLQLKEVVVIPKKSKKKEMEIGYFKRKIVMLHCPSYAANIYMTFIPFPSKGSHVVIKTIKFVYSAASKNYPIRIRILKANDNGEAGEDLVNENIIFKNYKPDRALISSVANIDVSKYNIDMPQTGVFIGIEWLSDGKPLNTNSRIWDDGPYINSVKTGVSSYAQWINFNNNSQWQRMSSDYTLAIGLTVVDYIE